MTGARNRQNTPQSYFVSTPYIDAYSHDFEPDFPKLDYPAFVEKMRDQAYFWGEQGVGRQALMGSPKALHDGEHVLAFGSHGTQKYVAIRSVEDGISVVPVDDIPPEWNVHMSETPKTSSELLFAQVKAALCLCPEDWPGENEDGHRALRAIEEQFGAALRALREISDIASEGTPAWAGGGDDQIGRMAEIAERALGTNPASAPKEDA